MSFKKLKDKKGHIDSPATMIGCIALGIFIIGAIVAFTIMKLSTSEISFQMLLWQNAEKEADDVPTKTEHDRAIKRI